jgi:hypothetical protein
MSMKARTDVARLEQRYAKHFGLDRSLVEAREYSDDWVVSCPSKPDLPEWSLGYND